MIDDNCKNFERVHIDELKDHQLRELVNDVTKIARYFGNTQQLRERICGAIISVLRPRRNHAPETAVENDALIAIDDPVIQGVHYERELVTNEEKHEITHWLSDVTMNEARTIAEKFAGLTDIGEIIHELAQVRQKTRMDAVNRTIQLIKDK